MEGTPLLLMGPTVPHPDGLEKFGVKSTGGDYLCEEGGVSD